MIDKNEYVQLYETCEIDNKIYPLVASIYAKIKSFENVYSKIKIAPPIVIGCIHYRESNFNFQTHLHNGDPLTARTAHVPKGRPPYGEPPFSWVESAMDALQLKKIPDIWDIANTLYYLESYNGFGYRKRGIHSPYLWSGSNHYKKGKFVADGKFDKNAVDKQIGCAVILKYAELHSRKKET